MAQVMVAMSGGVDSAVAAAQLLDDGHEVTGVHLKLADIQLADQIPGQGCCTLDDAQDARRTAQTLGIAFYVWDMTDVFRDEVQTPFAAMYATGKTPNPCVVCNERVKYAGLLDRARNMGFDALATGHHARLRRGGKRVVEPGGNVQLLRAVDGQKDQSYVLYMASADQLAHTLLPIGELTKSDVRQRAADLGFRVATKPDSYDVCFIPDGDTAGYLRTQLPSAPGPIVELDGTVVGRHDGVWHYTVGQRRGLGIDPAPGDGGQPSRRFVVDVDAATDTVWVGPREALACEWLDIERPNWIAHRAPTGEVRVQIRAHGATVRGHYDEQSGRVELAEPVYGVALGQAAVLYDPDDVVCFGGGTICGAQRPAGLPVAV